MTARLIRSLSSSPRAPSLVNHDPGAPLVRAGLRHRASLFMAVVMTLMVFASETAWAKSAVGKLGALIGKAHIVRDGAKIPAKKGMEVFATDALVTEPKAVVKIEFTDGGMFMAFENSSVTIEEYDVKRQGDKLSLKSAFDIAKGKVRFFVKPGENRQNDATYKTKNAVMGIRGTSGFIETSGDKTQLVVTTGKVEVKNPINPAQSVLVPANHVTEVLGNRMPTQPKAASPELLQNLSRSESSAAGQENSRGAGAEDEPKDGESAPGEPGAEPSGGEANPDEPKQDSKRSEGTQRSESPEGKQKSEAQKQESKQGQGDSSTNRPAAAKKVMVFSEEGGSSVAVSDASAGSFSATVTPNVPGAAAADRAPAAPGAPAGGVAGAGANPAATASQVVKASEVTQRIQERIQESVTQSILQTTTAIQAAKEAATPVATPPPPPTSKTVRVKVVLPKP